MLGSEISCSFLTLVNDFTSSQAWMRRIGSTLAAEAQTTQAVWSACISPHDGLCCVPSICALDL